MEKELRFLNPDIALCEDIFKKGQHKTEFEHIWSEMDKFTLVLENVKSEFQAKGLSPSRWFEGFSFQYVEESHIMAKLAR